MFSFFKKKQAPAEEKKAFAVKAYLSGKVVPIEEVKDEVFSSKALGDGLAIEPVENVIVAPCDATDGRIQTCSWTYTCERSRASDPRRNRHSEHGR